ncbi:MAG: PEGA domain-containing protein [Acidobacteria bacterium]|nr:PEGA domain-containing protein [Acidobacteriota bacterium]
MFKKLIYIVASLLFIALFSIPSYSQRKLETVESNKALIPTKPTLGSLLVVSNPSEAEVYLNNKKIGLTNSKGELTQTSVKPGSYTVVIKRPEYQEHKEQIFITAGKPSTVNAKLKPTFAMILLSFTELGEDIKIDLDGGSLAKENFILDLENKTIKIKTTPGEHNITVNRHSYLPVNNKIIANIEEDSLIPISLERIPVNLVIKTLAGTSLYLDGEPSGKVPTTGVLKLTTLKPDKNYKLRLELDGYEPKEELVKTETEKDIELNLDLTPLPTSAAFSETFLGGLTFWDAPKSWRAENGLLYVNGEIGVGLPKNKRYRDCNVTFGLRLNKGGGAVWVLRAKDEKNYYLFYLGGTIGKFANQFRVYVCRDGLYNLDLPADPILPLPVALKVGEDYRIRIEIKDNVIQHWITPSNIGEEFSLGLFRDPNNSFPIGGMGFALIEGQDFLINAFDISLPTDKKATR